MEELNDDSRKSRLLADFLSMCRLCLTKNNVKIDIFNDQSVSLPLRIMVCASLEVNSSDQLSKRICDDCRYQLEKSYVFRKRCKNSDNKLRRYLRQLNAGKISEFFENSDDEEEYSESQKFFIKRQQEKLQQIEKEREEIQREFQQRIKNSMKDGRSRFHLEKQSLLVQEKQDVLILNTSLNQLKKASESINKSEIDVHSTTGSEKERNNDLCEKEKTGEIEVYEEPEEQETLIQNDDDFEFILNEEPEDNIPISEDNMDVSVEYKENDNVADSDYETENGKSAEMETNTKPLELNRYLKSSISTGEMGVFSIKHDKTNQYNIKPGTSKVIKTADLIEQSDPKNLIDRSLEDIDFNHLTNAVQLILAQQDGLHDNLDIKFKVRQRYGNVAEVEVRTNDGTIIVMEIVLESKLKSNNEELKVFHCTQCPRSYACEKQLYRHNYTHKYQGRDVKCQYCEKLFRSRNHLVRHVRLHNGEKPFKCDICGKCFIRKDSLKRHNMLHTGERPFKCSFCEKGFIQKLMLQRHITRFHTEFNGILRKCPLCPKSFTHSSGLRRHLTVHTGKVFPCSYCSKMFKQRDAYKRHIKTVHREISESTSQKS